MGGRESARNQQDARRVLAWLDLHARDVDEAAFWREYVTLGDPGDRLRYLLAYLDRRPLDPLVCPRPGRTMDADAQRALVVVGYLLGDFAAPDLPRIDEPWTWQEIAAWANANGGDGWDSWRDSNRAPGRYRAALARGALQIVCQPESARATIRAISNPEAVRQIGGFVVATVNP